MKEGKRDIVIWGTGTVGAVAGYYYKDISNIICYIDNDSRKWGKTLNGIPINSPDILKVLEVEVILALKGGADSVRKQLSDEYGVQNSVWFQMNQKEYDLGKNPIEPGEDASIVALSGGLGNQMFQYAFIKNLQEQGKQVFIDLSLNAGIKKYSILDVFPSIRLHVCTEVQKMNFIQENAQNLGQKQKKFLLYKEENINETKEKIADLTILDSTGGVFQGLFQTYQFAERVRDLLLTDFTFQVNQEEGFRKFYDMREKGNLVSIHIRRGDYLLGNNNWIYGDICTEKYYKRAMEYIKQNVTECVFVFFSDDVKWVRENYRVEDAVYIERDMFDQYQDWYDMYLMSMCKHHIIANSTFSWWGAWLNQNENKIVIAPEKWVNSCDYKDIYPEEWIQM